MTRQSVITEKKRRGPKPTGKGELVGVRVQPPMMQSLDAWIATQPDPKLSRPEAIRMLILIGLSAAVPAMTIEDQLAKVEKRLAKKIPAKPSPEKGMAVLKHGLAEVQHRGLVERKRSAASGRKAAAEPEGDGPAKPARGKKGSGVQDGALTRRAAVAAHLALTKKQKPEP